MARRAQPSRLSWPVTPEQWERLDQMLQEIYDDTDNGSIEVSMDQLSGSLPVSKGGTGLSSYTIGDLIYASAATTLSQLADVATGYALTSGGVGAAPAWGKINLATMVTGALGPTNGGTGLQVYTAGDMLYASALNTLVQMAIGSAGAFIRSTGSVPQWSTLTLPNSSAQGDIFISTAANVMTVLTKSASATRYLANTGVSNSPAWDQVDLATGVKGIPQDPIVVSVTETLNASYSSVVARKVTINSGIKITLSSGSIFRIL